MRRLVIITFVCGLFACLLLCAGTGTDRWKEHIDSFKTDRKYIGLWRACYMVEEGNAAGYPPFYDCDKDFLRPHLVEPPDWFITIRVLMIVSCILTFFGLNMMVLQLITDKHKKRGSKMSPASILFLIGGICGMAALTRFTQHEEWNLFYNYDGGGGYHADYWQIEPTVFHVNGVLFSTEVWYRWSFGLAWGGVGMCIFTFIVALLSDLTRILAARAQRYNNQEMATNDNNRLISNSM